MGGMPTNLGGGRSGFKMFGGGPMGGASPS